MMSKSSFLVSLKENNKRRIWIWLLSLILWFFNFPVAIGMVIYAAKIENLNYGSTGEEALGRITFQVRSWLDLSSGRELFFVSLLAVICAIQGFSYLYSRKKVDMYHSVPVSKTSRFAVINCNSVLIFLVPYVINMLLSFIVAAVSGGLNSYIVKEAFWGLLIVLLLYLSIYAIALLAVMMTGTVFVTLLGTAVFLFYEAAVKALLYGYQGFFFKYFSYQSENYKLLTSPWSSFIEFLEAMNMKESSAGEGIGSTLAANAGSLLQMAVLAVIFGGAAYFCYRIRPSEAAGKPIAFPKTKAVIKVLIVVPVSLCAGIIAAENMGDRTVSIIYLFWMAAALILVSCIMEIIYEIDVKAAFHKKYQILISGIIVAAVFCIFKFDLIGFDKWVPEADKLEDAVILVNNDVYNQYYNEELMPVFLGDMTEKLPGIPDTELIEKLSKEKASSSEDTEFDGYEVGITAVYRMKNGKTVWRDFSVDGERDDLLNPIVKSPEYKQMNCQLYNEQLYERLKLLKTLKITFNGGSYVENIAREDMDMIRSLYLMDFENADYSLMKEEYVCGVLNFVEDGYRNRAVSLSFNIYPSYQNVIGYLKEKEIYKENILTPEDIASITVTNYHYELWEDSPYGRMYGNDINMNFPEITKTFTDKKEIEKILPALYPNGFGREFMGGDTFSDNYGVTVQLRENTKSSSYYRADNDYILISDKIPDFVETETAYE